MKAKITCVTDNSVKKDSGLRSEHGVSFHIAMPGGNVLFDTGQSSQVLEHNLQRIGIDIAELHALAISHSHYDHTGGLSLIFSKNSNIPIYAHTDLFQKRYSLRDGEFHPNALSDEHHKLLKGANLRLSASPQEILPNLWTSGEIVKRPEPMGSSPYHFIREGHKWVNDPYLDDMSLVLHTIDGMVLICGCCHAGLINTLLHIEAVFKLPVEAVIGGTHLMSADDQQLKHIIGILSQRYPHLHMFPNHCTGEKAADRLIFTFGERVQRFSAGSVLEFEL